MKDSDERDQPETMTPSRTVTPPCLLERVPFTFTMGKFAGKLLNDGRQMGKGIICLSFH